MLAVSSIYKKHGHVHGKWTCNQSPLAWRQIRSGCRTRSHRDGITGCEDHPSESGNVLFSIYWSITSEYFSFNIRNVTVLTVYVIFSTSTREMQLTSGLFTKMQIILKLVGRAPSRWSIKQVIQVIGVDTSILFAGKLIDAWATFTSGSWKSWSRLSENIFLGFQFWIAVQVWSVFRECFVSVFGCCFIDKVLY